MMFVFRSVVVGRSLLCLSIHSVSVSFDRCQHSQVTDRACWLKKEIPFLDMNNVCLCAFVWQLIHYCANLWLLLWTQISRVHSSVVRAADCRSAGPWFNSRGRSWFTSVTWSNNLTSPTTQMFNSMSPLTRKSVKTLSPSPLSPPPPPTPPPTHPPTHPPTPLSSPETAQTLFFLKKNLQEIVQQSSTKKNWTLEVALRPSGSRSHPRNGVPSDRRYSKYLTFLLQDQFLRSIEQCFEMNEVRTLGCTHVFLEILSKMHCRFHSRSHEDSPDHRVDVNVRHFVSLRTTQFLCVHLKRIFQDGQHWIAQSWGEILVYQKFCLSFPPRVSPYW